MSVTTNDTLCVNRPAGDQHKFTMFTDPGHGWLVATLSQLRDAGVYDKVSSYSYKSGELAYLEEDCDAGLFLEAYMSKHGLVFDDIKIVEIHTDHDAPCRNFGRF